MFLITKKGTPNYAEDASKPNQAMMHLSGTSHPGFALPSVAVDFYPSAMSPDSKAKDEWPRQDVGKMVGNVPRMRAPNGVVASNRLI